MKRWVAFIATVGLLLAGDKGASSDAQPLGWLISDEASLSGRGAEESKGHPKIASRLIQAVGMAHLFAQPGPAMPFAEGLTPFARFDQQGRVEVYITLGQVNESTLNALRETGVEIEIYDASQRLVQGWIAPSQVQAVADLPSATFVDLPNYGMTSAGSVTTQGDAVIRADQVRAQGFTGSGVNVGVLSNGVNGLTSSIASGDLPPAGIIMPAAPLTGGGIALDSPLPGATGFTSTPVDRPDLTTGSEGLALLEIIHDIAPDAQLFFAPGGTTLADQRAIRWLKSQGVKVVADDHFFLNAGPYDGTSAISQEASSAVASGVSYFVAVGNLAQQHYRGLFTDTDGDGFHEFDVSLGLPRVDNAGETLNVTVQPGEIIVVYLQWSDPFGASTNNYDLCVNDPPDDPTAHVFCSTTLQTGIQNPTEALAIQRTAPTPGTLGISINKVGMPAPRIFDLFIFTTKGSPMNEFAVPQGSIPNKFDAAGGVLSVGAVNWQTPNSIEFFSSRGPTSDGRLKPELVAPDGVSTSVPGFTPLFGTSAAAPHAAGAAALLLSANPTLTPPQLSAILTATAVPLGFPSPNNTFGFGRVDALLALTSFTASSTTVVAATLPTERAVQAGGVATAFATILNIGAATGIACAPAPLTSLPALFAFQTTDPQTNVLIGTINTPANIPPQGAQTFVFAFFPFAPFPRTEIQLRFNCANAAQAPIFSGVNTFFLRATTTPAPDPVALAATLNNDGIVRLASIGVFAVATVNLGVSGLLTVSADTGAVALPVSIAICETDPQTSVCLAPPTPTVQTQVATGATPTFGVFVTGTAPIPFDPANSRIQVHLEGGGGGGGTSVAVCSVPQCP